MIWALAACVHAGLTGPCDGRRVELAAALYDERCRVDGDARPLPAEVEVEVEPSLTGLAGDEVAATVVLRNRSGAVQTLWIRSFCGLADQIEPMVFDGEERVDLEVRCGSGLGCSSSTVAVRLAPRGEASFPFAVGTMHRRHDGRCEIVDVEPLPPGTYTVRLAPLFLEEPLEAPLELR